MTDKMKEKRKLLRQLSKAAAQAAAAMGIEDLTVNQLLMQYIYNPDNKFTFKSFKQWKAEGYTVKKGAKAYLLWGQPLNSRVDEETGEIKNDDTEENIPPFYPIAYLFRSDQVFKPEPKKPAQDSKPARQTHTQTAAVSTPF